MSGYVWFKPCKGRTHHRHALKLWHICLKSKVHLSNLKDTKLSLGCYAGTGQSERHSQVVCHYVVHTSCVLHTSREIS